MWFFLKLNYIACLEFEEIRIFQKKQNQVAKRQLETKVLTVAIGT